MASIRHFFLCFLVFSFGGFFSLPDNFVFGSNIFNPSNLLQFLHSKGSTQDLSPDISSNFLAKPIRAAIQATSKLPCHYALTIFTALNEVCLVNQTTQSLNLKILSPVTVALLTGGIFGSEVYELHQYLFFWKNNYCNTTHNLESRVYYFNIKYGSFEKALDSDDGIVIINFPVATNGDIPSWKFAAFSKILSAKIKEPGDFTKAHSAYTYTWYVNYPYLSVYHSYRKTLVDAETGKSYVATVIELPLDPRFNFISNEQFKTTFGKIKGVSGGGEDSLLSDTPHSWKQTHVGVKVINLPA